ncbi:MAG: DoxX family protein [Flectobacillus sp.]|uniref:DoxX family protein n=1 Tax=Flectobacillus sp. TaxID=50419 RepID=UPI003B9ABC81
MKATDKPSKVWDIFLWIAQGILALVLVWAAYTKLFQSLQEAAKMLPWAKDNIVLLKVTGVIDLLGALGIILPAATRIQPKLTVFAAYGIIALMIIASIFHISRDEVSLISMNIFFLLLAVFVVWGRTKKAIVFPKS